MNPPVTNIYTVLDKQKGFAGLAVLFIVALAIGGGAAYYFYTQVQNLESTPKPTGVAQDNGKQVPGVDEEKPQEAEPEVASLEAVGGYEGSGRATRIFENDTFTHTVSATLREPAEGKFYEGWLVDKTPELVFFSTGKLVKTGGAYNLEYTSKTNYEEYSDVVITEETEENGLDGVPENHVLEGTF